MITPTEKGQMIEEVSAYLEIRNYVSSLLRQVHTDVKNGVIHPALADRIIAGLDKIKTDSPEYMLFQEWNKKAMADNSYGQVMLDLFNKI